MTPVKCTNCRLSLPQNWSGLGDPNAKCPYCGKPFSAAPPAPAAATGTAPGPVQASTKSSGPAKTMLWGTSMPIPGVANVGKAAIADTVVAGSGSMEHQAPSPTAIPPAPVQPAPLASSDVPADDFSAASRPEPPAEPARISSKVNQPAATVMFEPSPDQPRPSFDRPDSGPKLVVQSQPREDDELTAPSEAAARPTPSKLKAKGKPVPKKGFQARGGAGWRAQESQPPAASKSGAASKKTLIIAVSSAALVVLVVVGILVLRPKSEPEKPAVEETPKAAASPTPSEPSANEEPAELAVKPSPSQPVAPPPKTAEPAPADKGAHEAKAPAEKPSEKGKPAAAAEPASDKPSDKPAQEKHEGKGKSSTSEADIQRANEAYQRANAKMFQGKTAEAIADFNEALKLNPKDPSIHRGLGLAYAQSGKSAEAAKHLKLYLKASPKANDRAIIQKRIHELK